MEHHRRNVFLLACCQALLLTNNVTLIALNGLAGFALADNKALATLPVTGYVVGAALSTFPASLWMKRVGRRNGFLTGDALRARGRRHRHARRSTSRASGRSCAGTLVLGTYNAFGQYYRFAAADAAPVHWRAKAISLVMAGGLVGGIVGPELSKYTRDLVQPTFLASYASLIGFCLVTMAILSRAAHPGPEARRRSHGRRAAARARSWRSPCSSSRSLVGALGYGVMNLLMTSTPLAMGFCGLPYARRRERHRRARDRDVRAVVLHRLPHPALRRPQRDDGGRRGDVRVRGHRAFRPALSRISGSRSCCWAWAGTSCTWAAPRSSPRPTARPRRRRRRAPTRSSSSARRPPRPSPPACW